MSCFFFQKAQIKSLCLRAYYNQACQKDKEFRGQGGQEFLRGLEIQVLLKVKLQYQLKKKLLYEV